MTRDPAGPYKFAARPRRNRSFSRSSGFEDDEAVIIVMVVETDAQRE